MIGDFAISKSGHDKDKIYVIVKEDKDCVYLSDGRLKPVDKLKRKNRKHIQIIKRVPESIRETCYRNGAFYNEGIKKALKDYQALKMPNEQED